MKYLKSLSSSSLLSSSCPRLQCFRFWQLRPHFSTHHHRSCTFNRQREDERERYAMQCDTMEEKFRAQTQYVTIIIENFSSKLMAYLPAKASWSHRSREFCVLRRREFFFIFNHPNWVLWNFLPPRFNSLTLDLTPRRVLVVVQRHSIP